MGGGALAASALLAARKSATDTSVSSGADGIAIALTAHNYGQVVDIGDRVNQLQHGEITLAKRSADTPVADLLELVHAAYRLNT